MSWRWPTAAESPAGLARARARAEGGGAPAGPGRLLPQETSGRVSERSGRCGWPARTLYFTELSSVGPWGSGVGVPEPSKLGVTPLRPSVEVSTQGRSHPCHLLAQGQAVCVWVRGHMSAGSGVETPSGGWDGSSFMCDCPSKSSLVKRPTPKLGEAPSPSRLDRKLLQWCLRAHDPRGPAALRDEVAEAVEQPRGRGSGGGHGVTARLLLSAAWGLSHQTAPLFPHPRPREGPREDPREDPRGGARAPAGRGAGQVGGGDPEKTGAAGAGQVALPKRSRASHPLLCSGLPGRAQHPQGRPMWGLGGAVWVHVCVWVGVAWAALASSPVGPLTSGSDLWCPPTRRGR